MFGLSRLRAVEIGVALLLTLAALLIGFRVLAEERGIRVSDAWARPTAGQSTTSAAYMTIANQGEGSDVLTAARTPKAKAIELHQTTMTAEGVMQMRQIKDGLPIEAGKTIELKPGGIHFMLLGLDGGLNAGEALPLTLEFAKAGAVEVAVPVSADAPAEKDGAGHAHH
ncbi:MAG: copper chaperone PCu(A)C [Methyloceanibacter sp.]